MPHDIEILDQLETIATGKKVLGVSHTKIYKMIAAKELTAIKVGRLTKLRRSELLRFINGCPPLIARTGLSA